MCLEKEKRVLKHNKLNNLVKQILLLFIDYF